MMMLKRKRVCVGVGRGVLSATVRCAQVALDGGNDVIALEDGYSCAETGELLPIGDEFC